MSFLPFSAIKAQIVNDTIKGDSISLEAFYDMSIEQLDSIKASGVSSELEKFINSLMSISTSKSLSSRNNPGIVTLITREEILNSGARDLIDVLRLVPGFHFAQDTEGKISIGIRGNWANAGKVLLMIDGNEINEPYTAHLFFGSHYSPEFIQRIEIIRGPGSAIYGGFAEFGVINVVTRSADDLSGISLGTGFLQADNYTGGYNWDLYFGKKWKKASFHFSFQKIEKQMSDRTNWAFYDNPHKDSLGTGNYVSLDNNSESTSYFINMGYKRRNWGTNLIIDSYRATDVTKMNSEHKRNKKIGLVGTHFNLYYNFKVNKKLSIKPVFGVIIQIPWEKGTEFAERVGEIDTIDESFNRIWGKLNFSYDFNHRINFIGGFDFYTDYLEDLTNDSNIVFYTEDEEVRYYNKSAFLQGLFKLPLFNVTVGGRFETNSKYGHTWSPRIGITRKFNKFHVKLLFADAHRTPSVGQYYNSFDGTYEFNSDSSAIKSFGHHLKTEKTIFFEIELGYQISKKMFINANVFNINTRNPIVYSFYQDETIRNVFGYGAGINVYQNYEESGSRGFEIDYRIADKWGYFNLNYSYYSVKKLATISPYAVSTFDFDAEKRERVNSTMLLGFPKHKINMNFCYYLNDNISANLTGTFFGKRYTYDILVNGNNNYDISGKLVEKDPFLLLNLYFRYKNLFVNHLNFGIGVYDIFNQKIDYLQPYFGLNVPMKGPSREYEAKLTYDIPFKNRKERKKDI